MPLPPHHARDLRDGLLFHRRAGSSTVERMVVGVDPLGQRVGQARYRVGRLHHLTGVQRMEVGVVVLQALGDLGEDLGDRLLVVGNLRGGEVGKAGAQPLECGAERVGQGSGSGPSAER